VRTEQPGLRYHWPSPFEAVERPKVTRVERIEIGYRSGGGTVDSRRGTTGDRDVPDESLMLTGDENIIDVDFTVFWLIKDAGKYLFKIRDPRATVKKAAESAMREVIGRTELQPALTEARQQIETSTLALLQTMLDEYQTGIQVTQIQLQKADPPVPVVDAFNDVQRARADRERLRNEAEAYRNDIIPRARGDAERLNQEAQAYREQVVSLAQGDASRFTAIYTAYDQSKDVVSRRMYLETMEQVLRGANKVILDTPAGSPGVVPYLPLPQLPTRAAGAAASSGAPAPATSPRREEGRSVMNRTLFIAGVAAVVGVLLLAASLFTVTERQQALVLSFGQPIRVIQTPGLKAKWPIIQDVVLLDRRILDVDPPVEQVILSDQKRIDVDAFARYRIVDPLKFFQSVGNEAVAEQRLASVVNSALRRVLGNVTLLAVLSKERTKVMTDIKSEVNDEAKGFGIEIVDVRIRRADLPEETSQSIFARMRSERERDAAEARAQGQEQAQQIRSRADRERTVILAEAQRDAQKARGTGDNTALKIISDATGRDPQFYAFYRTLEAYRNALREDTTMVLSPSGDFFRYFGSMTGGTVAPAPAPTSPAPAGQ
jgi:membrane protease subunit HflC